MTMEETRMNNKKTLEAVLADALKTCSVDRPGDDDCAGKVAEYLRLLLTHATGPWMQFEARPLAYPQSSKMPMVIYLGQDRFFVFWYTHQMSDECLCDELAELLVDAMMMPLKATS